MAWRSVPKAMMDVTDVSEEHLILAEDAGGSEDSEGSSDSDLSEDCFESRDWRRPWTWGTPSTACKGSPHRIPQAGEACGYENDENGDYNSVHKDATKCDEDQESAEQESASRVAVDSSSDQRREHEGKKQEDYPLGVEEQTTPVCLNRKTHEQIMGFKRQAREVSRRLCGTEEQAGVASSMAELKEFLRELGNGSIAIAWRRYFDIDGKGELSLQTFCDVLQDLQYTQHMTAMFEVLGLSHCSDCLTLGAFDPQSMRLISWFGQWCSQRLGGPLDLFLAIDTDNTGSLTYEALLEGVRKHGLFDAPDIPESLSSQRKFTAVLLPILDPLQLGIISQKDVVFLEQDPAERRRLQRQLGRARDMHHGDSRLDGGGAAARLLDRVARRTTQLGGRHWKQNEVMAQPWLSAHQGCNLAEGSSTAMPSSDARAGIIGRRERLTERGGQRPLRPQRNALRHGADVAGGLWGWLGREADPRKASATTGVPGGACPVASGSDGAALRTLPLIARSASHPGRIGCHSGSCRSGSRGRKSERGQPATALEPVPARSRQCPRQVYGKKLTANLPALAAAPHHGAKMRALNQAKERHRRKIDLASPLDRCEDFFRPGGEEQLFERYWAGDG